MILLTQCCIIALAWFLIATVVMGIWRIKPRNKWLRLILYGPIAWVNFIVLFFIIAYYGRK